jgi:predicted DNA-binding transcriptional regulator YafY
VQDTSELRRWLLGFGSGAEVFAPKSLRDEFRSIAKDMVKLYK